MIINSRVVMVRCPLWYPPPRRYTTLLLLYGLTSLRPTIIDKLRICDLKWDWLRIMDIIKCTSIYKAKIIHFKIWSTQWTKVLNAVHFTTAFLKPIWDIVDSIGSNPVYSIILKFFFYSKNSSSQSDSALCWVELYNH